MNTDAAPQPDFGGVKFFLVVYACVSAAIFLPNVSLYVYSMRLSLYHKRWIMARMDALFEELKTGLGRPQMSYLECFNALNGEGHLDEADELRMSQIVEGFNRRRPVMAPADIKYLTSILQHEFLKHWWMLSLDNISRRRYYTIITSVFYHSDAQHYLGNGFFLSVMFYIAFGCGWAPWPMAILAIGSGIAGCLVELAQFRLALLAFPDPPDPENHLMDMEINYRLRTRLFCGASGIISAFSVALPLLCPKARGLLLAPLWLFSLCRLGVDAWFAFRGDTRGLVRTNIERLLDGRPGSSTTTSHVGHVVGAACGLLFVLVKLTLG
ncbi:rhomboid-domain-containing protein [Apiospora marii]|uniref:Rhomboid-domain-containing protein n=2 Tax=Apiospora marii TaxID=335849 RepID=A0ABR1QZK9_9PEZI